MIVDTKNTKVRNAFAFIGILGFVFIFLPPLYDSMKYQNCIGNVGIERKELCELPQYLNADAAINPLYAKLIAVAMMILGCLFILASGGYFVTKLLKKEVSKMRKDVADHNG